MSIEIGQQAPDFTLFDDQMTPFTLSDLRGKKNVVLLFFPGAFTSVCTTELNTVSNDLDAYGSDTQVVGISTDSPFALAEFRKVNGFRFPLLSDHDAEVCAAYGAKYDHDFTPMKLDRIAKRAAFVIDRDGEVRYAEVLEHAGELPNLDAVKAVLSEL
ncbi:redoxin domain-containing protein [Rhodocaloribacter sp.]